MAKAKKVKEPMGRPTKYQPQYDEQAYKLCLLGATDIDLANFFNVAESTIHKWKLDYPSFSESITRGKAVADMEVAQSLYTGTKDRVVEESQAFKVKRVYYTDEGKRIEEEKIEIVPVERVIPGEFRNQQFWLKNRKPAMWRDKTEIDHTTKGERINLANVPTDVLKTLLNASGQSDTDS